MPGYSVVARDIAVGLGSLNSPMGAARLTCSYFLCCTASIVQYCTKDHEFALLCRVSLDVVCRTHAMDCYVFSFLLPWLLCHEPYNTEQ